MKKSTLLVRVLVLSCLWDSPSPGIAMDSDEDPRFTHSSSSFFIKIPRTKKSIKSVSLNLLELSPTASRAPSHKNAQKQNKHQEAARIHEEIGEMSAAAKSYFKAAYYAENKEKKQVFYLKAAFLFESSEEKERAAETYYKAALLFDNPLKRAIKFEKAANLYKILNQKKNAAKAYHLAARAYEAVDLLDAAKNYLEAVKASDHPDDKVFYFSKAASCYEALDDKAEAARTYSLIAELCQNKNEKLYHFFKAAAFFEAFGKGYEAGCVYFNIAVISPLKIQKVRYFSKAALYLENGDALSAARAYGAAADNSDNNAQKEVWYKKAADFYKALDTEAEAAKYSIRAANASTDIIQKTILSMQAAEFYEKEMEYASAGNAYCYAALFSTDNVEKKACYVLAARLFEKGGDDEKSAQAYFEAACLEKDSWLDRATWYIKAASLSKELGQWNKAAEAYFNAAQTMPATQNPEQKIKLFLKAAHSFEEAQAIPLAAHASYKAALFSKDKKQQYAHFLKAAHLYEAIDDKLSTAVMYWAVSAFPYTAENKEELVGKSTHHARLISNTPETRALLKEAFSENALYQDKEMQHHFNNFISKFFPDE